MSSTNLLGKIGEIMIQHSPNQEDDWMVVISNSVFNEIWTRGKKVLEWYFLVKVIKMMEVDDMIRVANSIAIMAFTYFAFKLVIIPAWNYVFWKVNEKLFQDSRLFPEKFVRGAINEY